MLALNESYSRENFIEFINGFLPDFEKDVRKITIENLKAIKNATYLGRSKDLDLQIFELTHKISSDARVTLATDGFRIMKQSGGFQALAVFRSDDGEDWRLSLMTATPKVSEKGKAIISFSNPRRYSFFLGPNAKINTPTKFLISKGKVTGIDDLRERFSLEVVNKDFYKEISQAFTNLANNLLKLPSTEDKSKTSLEFAVRLIGRIIFCWFLREKRSETGSSLISKDILSLEAIKQNENYYHSLLEPVFFEILNKPIKSRRNDLINKTFSHIPYLNGGLFSPQEDDFYKRSNGDLQSQFHNTLIIPDSWFLELFETLEKYNFTIDENTGYDEELSIDPEMLGRIFENLLAEINPETGESARKNTGSYYTPRSIVNYMVDESLLSYLKYKTSIEEDKLTALISYDLIDDSKFPLTPDEKTKVINALENLTLLDPACGSGAFPIGALQKIVFILQQIDPQGKLWFERQIKKTSPELRRVIEREFINKNFDYIRKLGVIRENIYGIDIQPIATEISKLRCFLTLIVDQQILDNEENRGIEPLPNLDFKFVIANTLINLPESNFNDQMSLFEDDAGIAELKELRDLFFDATGTEREQLKLQFVQAQNKMFQRMIQEGRRGYADLTIKLSSWDPFSHKASSWFDPNWMFGISDGFDIVIANPPYISFGLRGTQKMSKEERDALVKMYPNSAEYKISLYAIFMDKAIQLSKADGGIQTYIVPDSFLLGRYFSKIRSYILKTCEIAHISWLPYKIFEATVGYSVVYTFVRKASIDANHLITVRHIKSNSQIAERTYHALRYLQSYYLKQDFHRFRMFFDEPTMNLVSKIEHGTTKLGIYFTGRTGVRSLIGQKNIISKEQKGETWQKGLISGAQIIKYKTIYNEDYINIDPKLLNKGGWDYDVIHNPKILIRQTADSLTASLDDNSYYHLNNIHSFAPKNSNRAINIKFLLALLNSKLFTWFYQVTTLETGRTMAQTDIETLEALPVKIIKVQEQEEFIILVNKILNLTTEKNYFDNPESKNNVTKYEQEIDSMIYKLYELNNEEIKIIENNN